MIIQALAFYLFAGICTLSAVMVISARNPVHSVLFLILAFFNAAALFVLLGAEFLAMILVVVYVGAVAVLFLFVVMMLDINFVSLRRGLWKYMPIGALIALILVAELVFILASWSHESVQSGEQNIFANLSLEGDNTEALGLVLYTDYFFLFQLSGMVLFVAMIGAIVLTLRQRPGVKRQNITRQNTLSRDQVVEVRKVETGKGI